MKIIRRFLLWCMIPAMLAFVTGCQEIDEEYTINPDGSGKVTVAVKGIPYFGAFEELEPGDPIPSKEEMAGSQLMGFFRQMGLRADAWSDVEYGMDDDGTIRFRGTGYFRDISAIDKILMLPVVQVESRDDNLDVRLGNKEQESRSIYVSEAESAPNFEDMSDEEIDRYIAYQQARWNSLLNHPHNSGAGSPKRNIRVHLPGSPVDNGNAQRDPIAPFTVSPDGVTTVNWVIDKKAETEELRKQINDRQWWLDSIRDGTGMFAKADPEAMTRKRSVVIVPGNPLFDFDAEAGKAEQDMTDRVRDLFPEKKQPLQTVTADTPMEVAVLSASFVSKSSEADRADSWDRRWQPPGWNVEMQGKPLPKNVVRLLGGELTEAALPDGTSAFEMMPLPLIASVKNIPYRFDDMNVNVMWREEMWRGETGDSPMIQFSVSLYNDERMTRDHTIFRSLAGHFTFIVYDEIEEVDLGEVKIEKGAANDAKTVAIRDVDDSGNPTIRIDSRPLKIASNTIDGMKALDKDGNVVPLSWHTGGFLRNRSEPDGVTIANAFWDRRRGGGIPETLRFILLVRGGTREVTVPFRVADLDLVNIKEMP